MYLSIEKNEGILRKIEQLKRVINKGLLKK